MLKQIEPHNKIILTAAFLIIIALVIIVSWASLKDSNYSGIGLIALDSSNRVWIQADAVFYILNEDGTINNRFTAAQLGIKTPITGIAGLPDGDMLIGSRETATLHFIHPDGSPGAVIDLKTSEAGKPFGLIHLAYHQGEDSIVLSDTSNHRIIMLRRNGELLSQSVSGLFLFPNDMVVDTAGRILVADTNNHSVKALFPLLSVMETWSPFATSEYQRSSDRYRWPVHLAIDRDDNLYLTNHDDKLEFAEIVKLNPDGKGVRVIPLLNNEQPVALVMRQNDLLFTDYYNYQVAKLDLSNNSVERFGSSEFQETLEHVKHRHKLFGMIVLTGQIALVVILLALLALLIAFRRAESNRPLTMADQTDVLDKPSLLLQIELGTVVTLISLFRLTVWTTVWIILITLIGLIPMIAAGSLLMTFIRWSALSILLLGIFSAAFFISLIISTIGNYVLAKGTRSGRYHPVLRYNAKRMLSRHLPVIEKLSKGNSIEYYSMAIVSRNPALVLLVGHSVFIMTLNRFGSIVYRIQEIGCSSLKSIILVEDRTLSGRLWPINYPVLHFVFKTSEAEEVYNLDFIDYVAAKEMQSKISVCSEAVLDEASAPSHSIDRCAKCGEMVEKMPCPECKISEAWIWKPAVLSAIFPGLGQLYNGEFGKGIALLVYFSMLAIYSMNPIMAKVYRTSEVSMTELWQLFITAAFVWLFSLVDAVFMAMRRKNKNVGL